MSAFAQPASFDERALSEEPVVRAAPLNALALEQMPSEAHFRRDHFPVPDLADPAGWTLAVVGRVARPLRLGLDALAAYPTRDVSVVLQCAGHRRAELDPPTSGLPWGPGAVSEAVWSGVPLRHVLAAAGLRGRYVVLESADHGPFRDEGDVRFARALPLEKALHPDTLLAWQMNGKPLPHGHGAPLRAIVPGWYATDSVKWLSRITVLDEPFSGPFEARDYRVDGNRLTTLPVNALVTSHHADERLAGGVALLRGIAWGGSGGVARVDVSLDGGEWQPAELLSTQNRYGRVRWTYRWHAKPGIRTIAVRATDAQGTSQPDQPQWNERGYANSSVQRLHLLVRPARH